jgi:hypothetical protein
MSVEIPDPSPGTSAGSSRQRLLELDPRIFQHAAQLLQVVNVDGDMPAGRPDRCRRILADILDQLYRRLRRPIAVPDMAYLDLAVRIRAPSMSFMPNRRV